MDDHHLRQWMIAIGINGYRHNWYQRLLWAPLAPLTISPLARIGLLGAALQAPNSPFTFLSDPYAEYYDKDVVKSAYLGRLSPKRGVTELPKSTNTNSLKVEQRSTNVYLLCKRIEYKK